MAMTNAVDFVHKFTSNKASANINYQSRFATNTAIGTYRMVGHLDLVPKVQQKYSRGLICPVQVP